MEQEQDSPRPIEENSTAICRRDGWTPFARRLFLEVLAETGRVSRACDFAGLSVSSAYALRHRDPIFAASWDAACELARTALADALYERALDGTTETITRNGEVIAERHRHDSRLSIAVLHRLDKRCDRSAELGARHLLIIEKWDEWLSLVGKGAEAEAAALLEPARSANSPDLQLPQLPLSENPTEDEGLDLSDRCWWDDDDECWMTDFPPPPGFDGYESRGYDEINEDEPYVRACTDEEAAILEADRATDRAADRTEEEELRDQWFDYLKSEANSHPAALREGQWVESGH